MEILKFDLNSSGEKIKILNATNGGPWHKRHADDQFRSNFADYKAARIPYSRNHDSAVCGIYGGPYSDNDDLPAKSITLDVGKKSTYEIYRVDSEHSGELVEITDNLTLKLELFSIVLIKEQ